MSDPFHHGEISVQEQTGERDKAVLNGRIISSVIPMPARSFLAKQAYMAIGWVDAEQDVRAAIVAGSAGFVSSDQDGTEVVIRLPEDAGGSITKSAQFQGVETVGMLFIELSTRRRLRVNGIIDCIGADYLRVLVKQAYANCPKYIQRRQYIDTPACEQQAVTSSGCGVPADMQAWAKRTDTAFVASAYPGAGVDCSHRGGRRGFIQCTGEELFIPDYAGNSMFCTLGNISVNPRAALVMVDFENQRQLMLSGNASLHLSTPGSDQQTGGSGRWWSLQPRKWQITPLTSGKWLWVDESPFNP